MPIGATRHLIPAGTGFPIYKNIKLVPKGEPVGEPLVGQETESKEEGGEKFSEKIALENIVPTSKVSGQAKNNF